MQFKESKQTPDPTEAAEERDPGELPPKVGEAIEETILTNPCRSASDLTADAIVPA